MKVSLRVARDFGAGVAALALTATLAGCAGFNPLSINQASQGNQQAQQTPPASAEPTPSTASDNNASDQDFNPSMKLVNETVTFDDPDAPVSVKAKIPTVTDVNPEYAAKFSDGVRQKIRDKLKELSKFAIEVGVCPGPAQQCDPFTFFQVSKAQIFDPYATISYQLRYAVDQNTAASVDAASYTMNMLTGQVVGPEEFILVQNANVAAAIRNTGTCTRDLELNSDGTLPIDAFSPTDDGIYLSWDKGTMDMTMCGVGEVTLPWENFGTVPEDRAKRVEILAKFRHVEPTWLRCHHVEPPRWSVSGTPTPTARCGH